MTVAREAVTRLIYSMPEGIFINYRRKDALGIAGRLNDRLVQSFKKSRVFMDIDQIPAGADFPNYIASQLGDCGVLLALIGPAWLSICNDVGLRRLDEPNDYVVMEIVTALRQGVDVIPVLIDGTEMPSAAELPDTLKFLARRNAVELRNSHFGTDVERLDKKIRQLFKSRKAARGKSRWQVEDCDKSLGLTKSGIQFSGVFVGTVEDGSGNREVQTKLVRNGRSVKGSYYRGGICGKIRGEVIEGRMVFDWNWADSWGRGIAVQEGGKLTATSGLNENTEGLTKLVLFLREDNGTAGFN